MHHNAITQLESLKRDYPERALRIEALMIEKIRAGKLDVVYYITLKNLSREDYENQERKNQKEDEADFVPDVPI